MYNVILCVKGGNVLIDEKNTDNIPENKDLPEENMENTQISDKTENVDIKESDPTLLSPTHNEDSTDNDDPSLFAADEPESTEHDSDNSDQGCERDDLEEIATPESELESTPDDATDESPITESEKPKKEENYRNSDSIFDFIELFVFALAAIFIITSFFFRYSIVEGSSMVGTLHEGDKLIISDFMYEPEQGDIVVVHSDALDKVIVKRVIATEGQTVTFTATDVYVDGEKLDEPYVYTEDYLNILGGTEYHYDDPEKLTVTVPEGEIYVLGDHRNLSQDSRAIGTISEDAIIGKVIIRFAPFDKFGKVE